jgi:hypothetical protein
MSGIKDKVETFISGEPGTTGREPFEDSTTRTSGTGGALGHHSGDHHLGGQHHHHQSQAGSGLSGNTGSNLTGGAGATGATGAGALSGSGATGATRSSGVVPEATAGHHGHGHSGQYSGVGEHGSGQFGGIANVGNTGATGTHEHHGAQGTGVTVSRPFLTLSHDIPPLPPHEPPLRRRAAVPPAPTSELVMTPAPVESDRAE